MGRPAARWAHAARDLLVAAALALAIGALVQALVVQVYAIPTSSMRPLLEPGDRVLASRLDARSGDVRRADVVVFDGRGSFGGPGRYVKRVVGVGGDRVTCCTATGALALNGRPLDEPYLYPGDGPSDIAFDVVVPADRLWVMGDHRSASADSRAHLGSPGGGMVRKDRLIGRVVAVLWPPDRIGGIGRADEVAEATTGRTP